MRRYLANHKHQLHRCPDPWKIRCPVAQHLDHLGVMLHSPQERIKPSHVLLHAASAKLTLDMHRFISDILELGVVEQSLVVGCDGRSKTLKGVLKCETSLSGRRRHRAVPRGRSGDSEHNTLRAFRAQIMSSD
jgi:hypothetical protein